MTEGATVAVARVVPTVATCGTRTVRVVVEGELDLATVGAAGRVVNQVLEGGADLELDLAGLSFIDVVGLRAVTTWQARAADAGVRCEVVAVSSAVLRVERLTGLWCA